MLVNAPAAIEEAVALVLGTRNEDLHRAACLAYIHRLYSAFLVTQPAALSGKLPGYQWRYEAAISSGVPPPSSHRSALSAFCVCWWAALEPA